MKVYIGPYTQWVGPYQIAEKILFWKNKDTDQSVQAFAKWLSIDKHGNATWLGRVCLWIDSKKRRSIKVRIDDYDCWGLDTTLAYIIIPALKKLRGVQWGSPTVENVDVPEHLQTTTDVNDDDDVDEPLHEARWAWVMEEMIFAFESKINNWEEQFWSTKSGMTDEVAREGRLNIEKRIQRGFNLFGKYYQNLWD